MLRILKQIKARLKGTSYQNQYCIEVQKLGTSTEFRSKDANVSFDDQLIPLVVFIQMFTSVWQLCIELYETLIECQRLLSLLAFCRNLFLSLVCDRFQISKARPCGTWSVASVLAEYLLLNWFAIWAEGQF